MSTDPKDPLYETPSAVFSKEHIGRCHRVYRNRDGKLVEQWCNYDDPLPDDAEEGGNFVITNITDPGAVKIMLAGDITGQTHVGYHRNDAPIFHTIARAPGGAMFTIGDHFDTCPICKEHNVTLKDFHAFMRGHAS